MATPTDVSRLTSPSALVIGFGNELRGDDAVGPMVARLVEKLGLPDVSVLAVHQLTPEIAESISRAARVVFVDASARLVPGRVRTCSVRPRRRSNVPGHSCTPAALLALAEALYGHVPNAKLIRIGASAFDFAEHPSPSVERAVPVALRSVRRALESTAAVRERASRP